MAMKFEITDAQMVKLKEWQEKIKDLFGEYGNYTYSFTPTGIGDGVEVWSDLTKTKLDLTDVDTW
jgi:hypothetical protein